MFLPAEATGGDTYDLAPGLLAELRATRAASAREIELAGLGEPAVDAARIAELEAEYARAAQALRELRNV